MVDGLWRKRPNDVAAQIVLRKRAGKQRFIIESGTRACVRDGAAAGAVLTGTNYQLAAGSDERVRVILVDAGARDLEICLDPWHLPGIGEIGARVAIRVEVEVGGVPQLERLFGRKHLLTDSDIAEKSADRLRALVGELWADCRGFDEISKVSTDLQRAEAAIAAGLGERLADLGLSYRGLRELRPVGGDFARHQAKDLSRARLEREQSWEATLLELRNQRLLARYTYEADFEELRRRLGVRYALDPSQDAHLVEAWRAQVSHPVRDRQGNWMALVIGVVLALLLVGMMLLLGAQGARRARVIAAFDPAGPGMVRVAPGSLELEVFDAPGFPPTSPWLHTRRRSVVADEEFFLGATEVTVAQFAAVMGVASYGRGDLPALGIERAAAETFCSRLTDFQRGRGVIAAGWRYALPDRDRWLLAAVRGAASGPQLADYAVFSPQRSNRRSGPEPTGSRKSDRLGFFDLYGNAYELVYGRGGNCLIVGGAWFYSADLCNPQACLAGENLREEARSEVGFRVLLERTDKTP